MKPFKLDNGTKTDSGFKIPDNYFENFQANVMEKISKEPVARETKIISLFRKRKTALMAVAAVLTLALIVPAIYKASTKNKDLDATTIENYLAEETHLNQDELIGEIESRSDIMILNPKEIETQTIEDMLVSNPNIENLVIENQN